MNVPWKGTISIGTTFFQPLICRGEQLVFRGGEFYSYCQVLYSRVPWRMSQLFPLVGAVWSSYLGTKANILHPKKVFGRWSFWLFSWFHNDINLLKTNTLIRLEIENGPLKEGSVICSSYVQHIHFVSPCYAIHSEIAALWKVADRATCLPNFRVIPSQKAADFVYTQVFHE